MSKAVQVLLAGEVDFDDVRLFLERLTNVRFLQNVEVDWALSVAEVLSVTIRLYEN